jgi:hypothetical protein
MDHTYPLLIIFGSARSVKEEQLSKIKGKKKLV